jgi:AraC-like DNA-binding protein
LAPRFDPDASAQPVAALQVELRENSVELPIHSHRKCQMVLASRGTVVCEVASGYWMVPPGSAIWIPSSIPHSNHVSPGGRICVFFIEPAVVRMPDSCCTLTVTPLLRELIFRVAALSRARPPADVPENLIAVLVSELESMPVERLYLPISSNARLRKIAETLISDPADRTTMSGWADRVATSERTLARLVKEETGMTFGRWRQQLHLIVALQRLSAGAKVQGISDELGYESASAFITMFKKALGKSPGKYLYRTGIAAEPLQ